MPRALVAVQLHVLLSYATRGMPQRTHLWPLAHAPWSQHTRGPLPPHPWVPLVRLQQLVRTDSACRWTGIKPCVHTLGLREGGSLVSTCQSSQAHEHNNHVCTPGGPMT